MALEACIMKRKMIYPCRENTFYCTLQLEIHKSIYVLCIYSEEGEREIRGSIIPCLHAGKAIRQAFNLCPVHHHGFKPQVNYDLDCSVLAMSRAWPSDTTTEDLWLMRPLPSNSQNSFRLNQVNYSNIWICGTHTNLQHRMSSITNTTTGRIVGCDIISEEEKKYSMPLLHSKK